MVAQPVITNQRALRPVSGTVAPWFVDAEIEIVAPALPALANPWGRLREVVVGHFEGAAMPGVARPLSATAPNATRETRDETEQLAARLDALGVLVRRPVTTAATAGGVDGPSTDHGQLSLYPGDEAIALGNLLIALRPRSSWRQLAHKSLQPALQETAIHYEMLPLAVPEWPGLFLEGGDIILLGRQVLVGVSSKGTSQAGAEWLARTLRPFGYDVDTIRLAPGYTRLNRLLTSPCPGLLVIDERGLLDGTEALPNALRSWRSWVLGEYALNRGGLSGLALGDNRWLSDGRLPYLDEALDRIGVGVETIGMAATAHWGGGLASIVLPLVRDAIPGLQDTLALTH